MSGNICAATNSPSPCSKATTTSSTNPAPRGASSPTTPNASHQSHPELGRRSILEADGMIPTAAAFDSFWDSQIEETLTRCLLMREEQTSMGGAVAITRVDLTAAELRAAAGR